VLSTILMFRRLARAVRFAVREEEFLPVLGAGIALVLSGTLTYTLVEGWNIVDSLYFAVATLTTTSVADPSLVLEHRAMKLFTVFYLLIGIGILVEILRRLGIAFVAVRSESKERRRRPSPDDDPDRAPPS
jgi:Ion channel